MDMRESLSITILTFVVRNYMGKNLLARSLVCGDALRPPIWCLFTRIQEDYFMRKYRGLV